jgi:hypothetical protein
MDGYQQSRHDLHQTIDAGKSMSTLKGPGKSGALTARGRNASAVSRTTGGGHNRGGGSFIPLRDLLKRNHDDRVQDYLLKMNEESETELMNPSSSKN